MKSLSTKRKFSPRELLYKCVLFLVTVTVIVCFLPREGRFNYQFDINKPWKYGLLQASFDFPIYKGDGEMRKEQDSIMKRYAPYFQVNKAVGTQMLEKFRNDYDSRLHEVIPYPAYRQHLMRMLTKIYAAGIIAPNDLSLLQKDSIFRIQVVDQNTSDLLEVGEVYTFKKAYELLIDYDTVRYQKALLQRCNLNEYIVPNLVYDVEKSEAARQDLLDELSWANGFVMNGQKIIDRGEIVDEHTYSILKSLEKEWDKRSETVTEKRLTLLGHLLFVAILIGCLMVYLELFRHDYYAKPRCLALLFIIIIIF